MVFNATFNNKYSMSGIQTHSFSGDRFGLGLWCLTPFSVLFVLYFVTGLTVLVMFHTSLRVPATNVNHFLLYLQ
jgi:hypothetical protein